MTQRHLSGGTLVSQAAREPRLRCVRTGIVSDFAESVAQTLARKPRSVHPRFFYGPEGSALFEQICELPEYYVTRTEESILESVCAQLGRYLDYDYRLVELGSGSGAKARHVLDALHETQRRVEYVPIDVSESSAEAAAALVRDYPRLRATVVLGTYERGLEAVRAMDGGPNLVAFFGSSIGNMDDGEAAALLSRISEAMGEGGMLLLGADLAKDRSVLEPAYNDSRGVTARFNMSVLRRMNAELGADFDLDAFEHEATYNESESRIEMYLRSTRQQRVRVPGAGLDFVLERDELIHTENSHKYSPEKIESMASAAGLELTRVWQDPESMFAVALARRKASSAAQMST